MVPALDRVVLDLPILGTLGTLGTLVTPMVQFQLELVLGMVLGLVMVVAKVVDLSLDLELDLGPFLPVTAPGLDLDLFIFPLTVTDQGEGLESEVWREKALISLLTPVEDRGLESIRMYRES